MTYSSADRCSNSNQLAVRRRTEVHLGASRASTLAARARHTPLELAFAGSATQPGVVAVSAGAISHEQVEANAAAGAWELGTDDLETLVRQTVGEGPTHPSATCTAAELDPSTAVGIERVLVS